MNRYFYDWEFEENGETILPISLGMVSNNGRELYLINRDYIDLVESGEHTPIQWIEDNVLKYITDDDYINYGVPYYAIAPIVLDFVSMSGRIKSRDDVELWADYAAYDHVRLAQCFGPMIKLPEPIPMYTNELRQELRRTNWKPTFKPEQEHHALYDAKWNKKVFDSINDE